MSTTYTGTAGAQSGRGLRLRRIGRLLGYGLLGLVGLLLVLLASGATYESIASRRAALRYQAPGRLVDVGGHRLHLHCSGQGSPTVVLDTGLGMPSASWVLVQPVVAQWTRVCAYDRAGYGFSDLGPTPRTSQRIVEELHALLDRAGEPAPYVLAGHSFGGFTIRLFASRYPSQVAGLVLIDASHEDFATRLHEADAQTQQRRRQTQRQIELGLAALPGQADHGCQHRSYDPSGAARGSDCGAPRCHRAGTEELTLIGRVRGGKDSRRLDSKKMALRTPEW